MPRRKPNKTKKAAAKRFKITATGKVLRAGCGKRHLNGLKSAKRKRRLSKRLGIDESHVHHIINVLPFNHRG
jgi:large subunit ribosomal protein L35